MAAANSRVAAARSLRTRSSSAMSAYRAITASIGPSELKTRRQSPVVTPAACPALTNSSSCEVTCASLPGAGATNASKLTVVSMRGAVRMLSKTRVFGPS
jgi:hypothetical protein